MRVNFSNFKILIQPSFLWVFFIGAFAAPLIAFGFLSSPDISKWVFIYSLTGLNFLFIFQNKIAYPPLSSLQSTLIILILGILTANFIFHHNSLLDKDFIDRILFWILFFSFLTSLKKLSPESLDIIFLPLFLGTIIFLIGAFINVIFFEPYHSFTFGNINKSAEFVGLSLAIQLAFLQRTSGYLKVFMTALASLCIAYLYFSSCRSTLAATACVILFLIYLKHISFKQLFLIAGLSTLCILSLEVIYHSLAITQVPFDGDLKARSFAIRWQLILNTLNLIIDHTLGVGIGRYPFAGLGYMKNLPGEIFDEGYYLFSPHNELLRILAEDGVLVCILEILLFLSVFRSFNKIVNISKHHPECISFFICLFFQCLFQFPLIQPYPVLITSFMLAYAVYLCMPLRELSIPYMGSVYKAVGLFLIYIAIAITFSIRTLTSETYIQEKAKLSYRLWPNRELLKEILFNAYIASDYKTVKALALEELRLNPYNLYAQKYLGLSLIQEGDFIRGCPYLKNFKRAFHRTGEIDAMINKKCKERQPF